MMVIVEMMDAVGVGRKCGVWVCGLEERLCGRAAMQYGCFVALCTLCGML